jgi:predicted small metal-binding protein
MIFARRTIRKHPRLNAMFNHVSLCIPHSSRTPETPGTACLHPLLSRFRDPTGGYWCEAQPYSREDTMERKYIDCREFPSEKNCTVAISADTEDELLEIATQHAVRSHGHTDGPELRAQLKQIFKTGVPA